MMFPELVHQYLSYSAQQCPDKTAIICGENRLSYRSLDNRSDRLATYLVKEGITKQNRVIVFLDNSVESVISIYGILKAGCVFVIINSSLKAKQL
ncbi:MAG: AMP-binding protein, partial [Candidatus Babeliaceae bacterium]|nr:AMP-binding protein [Candidatus Babeliaceae bacterium]